MCHIPPFFFVSICVGDSYAAFQLATLVYASLIVCYDNATLPRERYTNANGDISCYFARVSLHIIFSEHS